jgi:hypothetical protein
MARRPTSGLLAVDFFTSGYRISGHVSTRAKSVADMLNERLTSYLALENVYISRISSPGDIIATYAQAQLRKDSLLFAIVPSRESLSRMTRSVSYFGRHRLPVWLALPMFEIEGDLQVTGVTSFDLDAYLAKKTGEYLSVVNGIARPAYWPEVSFSGEAFLINQNCIDLVCLGEDSDK